MRSKRKIIDVGLAVSTLLAAGCRPNTEPVPSGTDQGEPPSILEVVPSLAEDLERDVRALAGRIGDRNVFRPAAFEEAAVYVEDALRRAGYEVHRQTFDVSGVDCINVWAELPGTSMTGEVVVIGAHYDSVRGCPGANDNGSGVAALLALARRLKDRPQAWTVRFVAFANEEPPFFQTDAMGSLVYARSCRQRGDDIRVMLCLETMGYYTDQPHSQRYPPPLDEQYPSTGNFIAFVSKDGQQEWVQRLVGAFRASSGFPCEGAALPAQVDGVGWSDHWSFWQAGYPAVMITDTATFRYPHYHTREDTPDKIEYESMAQVVDGLAHVVEALASGRLEERPTPNK